MYFLVVEALLELPRFYNEYHTTHTHKLYLSHTHTLSLSCLSAFFDILLGRFVVFLQIALLICAMTQGVCTSC